MIRITPDLLVRAVGCTAERAAVFGPHLETACAFYGISASMARLAAFLAQVGHESGAFRYVREIADGSAYEGRRDLGNVEAGDGTRYRGRGLIQTTGRANAARVRDRLRARLGDRVPDFEADPEQLERPEWAAWSACDFWDMRGLNALADADDFLTITRKINGGTNGLADRQARWERARMALAGASTQPAPIVDRSTPAPPPPAVPAPVKELDMPLPAFALAALPALASAVPEVMRLFGKNGEKAEKNARAAELVLGIAKTAAGVPNEQALVEALQNEPAAASAVREAVRERWFEIAEAGGGGIGGARAFDAQFGQGGRRAIDSPAFIVSCLLLVFPAMLLVDVFYVHPEAYGENLRTQIVTGVLMVISIVGAFWLGSSFGSRQKDERPAG